MLTEAIFLVDEARANALADALLDAGASSVSVEDADADSPDEQPIFGEPGMQQEAQAWRRSRLVMLLQTDSDQDFSHALADLMLAVRETGLDLPLPETIRPVDEQDWVQATQSQFDPIEVGRLWVVPSWHEVPVGAQIVLRLDPGMAFGTGTHPTTRLCLEWLERHLTPGTSVLDYGCGSGILAIAAAKLGAGPVEGVDIDEHAVIAARDNAVRNEVEIAFHDAHWQAEHRYDVVVANILSNPLKLLAPALIAQVKPGGALVLSGILERQAEEVAAVYAAQGLPMIVDAVRDGWVCLASRPRAD